MIKVRLINMHMNRSTDINDFKSREDDKIWMESANILYIPEYNYVWKDIQLTMDEHPDFYFVIDCIYRHFDKFGRKINYFDESKAIVMLAEPQHLRCKYPKTLYDDTDYDKRFLKVYKFNPFFGWTGYNIRDLLTINFEKTKNLSAIISTNLGLDGHQRRLVFLRDYLSKIDMDHFGDERGRIGAFSKDLKFSKNYKGYITTKKEALAQYKYTFSPENCRERDYFSEKFTDPILTETLSFYDGCLNAEDYINKNAFIRINLDDPENALYTIKRSIRLNEWEQRIDIIKQEKKKILYELNIMNLIWTAIYNYKNYWEK